MAGYGIQNAVGSVIDNSVKIQRMMDLLPSEEDKALANAKNAEEAARLKSELAQQDAEAYHQEIVDKYNKMEQDAKSMTGKQRASLIHDAGKYYNKAMEKYEKAQKKVEETSKLHRATIEASIAALEKQGQRKKTIFERLRGGFRDGK